MAVYTRSDGVYRFYIRVPSPPRYIYVVRCYIVAVNDDSEEVFRVLCLPLRNS